MTIDYDEVLEEIGECGLWQVVVFLLLWIPSATSAMAVFMFEFTAFSSDHRCRVAGCDSPDGSYLAPHLNYSVPWEDDKPSSCQQFANTSSLEAGCSVDKFSASQTEDCGGWLFDRSTVYSSAVEDYDMVCQGEWRKFTAQTVYMAGMLVGSFVFGWVSDKFGRKAAMMGGVLLLAVGGSLPMALPAAVEYYAVFVFLRFLSGTGHVGAFLSSFSLALECVGPKYRVLFGILIETPFALGGVLVGLVSWAGVRHWKTLSLVLSLPNVALFSYYWLLPESPRWLIATGNVKEAKRVLVSAAKVNKKELPTYLLADNEKSSTGETGEATLADLFRPRQILLRSSCMFINWLVTTLCYYGVTMSASSLMDDVYLNYTLIILVEVPAHFACILVMDRWGRRPVLGLSQLLAGLTCIGAGLVSAPDLRWLQVTLSLLGKFGATASFAIVFVYTAEMFPTEIRSSAVGTASTCARVGGILAPQVAFLASLWNPLPFLVMGGSALVGGVLVFLFLPETLGKKLPQNMEEALALK